MALSKAVSAMSLKFAVTAGAAATTNITVTGIATTDHLIGVQESAVTSADPTDRTSEASITSTDNIQLSTTSTATDKLIVLYHDSDGRAIDAPCYKFILTTGTTAAANITATGIATADTLIFVTEISATDAIWTDRTSEASITAANVIQCSTTDTSTDQILICYHDASGRGIASPALKWGQCNGSATTSTLTGVATGDTLLMVLELAQTTNVATLRTSTTTISAANTLTSGVSTVNDVLLVLYHDGSA